MNLDHDLDAIGVDLPQLAEAGYPSGTPMRYRRVGNRLILQAGVKTRIGLVTSVVWKDVLPAGQRRKHQKPMSLVERDAFEAAVEAKKAVELAKPKITLKEIEDAMGPTIVLE